MSGNLVKLIRVLCTGVLLTTFFGCVRDDNDKSKPHKFKREDFSIRIIRKVNDSLSNSVFVEYETVNNLWERYECGRSAIFYIRWIITAIGYRSEIRSTIFSHKPYERKKGKVILVLPKNIIIETSQVRYKIEKE